MRSSKSYTRTLNKHKKNEEETLQFNFGKISNIFFKINYSFNLAWTNIYHLHLKKKKKAAS